MKELEEQLSEIKKHLLEHYKMLKAISPGFYCEECEKNIKDLVEKTT